jgi:hypothetical protein
VLCPCEPNCFALGVVACFRQGAAGIGFEAKLGRAGLGGIIGHPRTIHASRMLRHDGAGEAPVVLLGSSTQAWYLLQ